MAPPWRNKLYEALDVDNTAGDDAFLASLGPIDELEALAALVRHHMPPEQLEEVGDLVEVPGGERLYHRLLVLSVAPPTEDHGTFEAAGVAKPPGRDVRYLTMLRDYAKKGDAERYWYYGDGELRSCSTTGGDPVVEIDDVEAYVTALNEALLE
ncbi:MAG: hypothetical protein ACI9KE_002391 [Polyangiales bacterium]|jgi:hypothetical protein